MPPRRAIPSYLTPGYFLCRITDISAAPAYQFVESWMSDDSGTMADKAGGRYGDADNPGFAVNGTTFAVDDLALCRLADGAAGAVSELIPLPGGSSPPPPPPSSWKTPAVRTATTTTLPANTYANGSSGAGATLTGNSNGALSAQDSVTLAASDDILVKNEGSASHNGIYTLTQLGDGSHPYILTRRTDCDTASDVIDAVVKVQEGALNADTVWECTADATITMGSTSLPWAKVGPYSVFGASGTTHSTGLVPDPSSSAGSTKFLREDATWDVVAFASSVGGGSNGSISPDNTWIAISSVSIPGAGTYLITANVGTSANISAGTLGVVQARVQDTTNTATVSPTNLYGAIAQVTGVTVPGYTATAFVITTAGAVTLQLQVQRLSGPTWSGAAYALDHRLAYVKLST